MTVYHCAKCDLVLGNPLDWRSWWHEFLPSTSDIDAPEVYWLCGEHLGLTESIEMRKERLTSDAYRQVRGAEIDAMPKGTEKNKAAVDYLNETNPVDDWTRLEFVRVTED